MNRITRSAPPETRALSLRRQRGYVATPTGKGGGDDVVRFGGSENLTVAHLPGGGCRRDWFGVLFGHHHGCARRTQAAHHVGERISARVVEPDRGLIEQDQLCSRGQGISDKHLAKVAERQHPAWLVPVPTKAKRFQRVDPSHATRPQMGEPTGWH